MKKILLLFLLLSNFGYITPCTLRKSESLDRLLDHLHLYKLTKTKFHAGNLLHHSLWTCRSLAQWFDEKDTWVENLENHRAIIILGGLLHDIGKGGDGDFFYSSKHTHPCDGFAYLWKQRPFRLEDGSLFDFKALYSELSISKQEQQLLAILVAMHWEFGLIMKNLHKNNTTSLKKECKLYLDKLHNYCKQTGFNKGKPTLKLLKACIAVSAADVRGVQPNHYANPTLIRLFGQRMAEGYSIPCYRGFNAYTSFKIEEEGLPIRKKLCDMLKWKKRP
jgi:hypothetical protein